ncbi:DUF2000 domain-containing protein [Blastococcus sp. KM273129]|uniref:DUF2000 domain-containing protein n=1 Tax=Blastococcus sp. KM273129 TaxID=2570315 RepID=UPI001F1ADFBE|nr:DUF2000 domain-containing protein [Blastococcus sp. KM273129]MCF6736190.1 DUF2000 domain-containing protein [Blastococcus sp. KM273129]
MTIAQTASESTPGTVAVPGESGPPWPTKIVVLLREGLLPWQELNVTAFLAGAVAAAIPELIGRPYEDADGTRYLAMIRQPVLVMTGSADVLATARERSLQRGLPTSVFTADLFATGGDAENRAAVRAVAAADLDLVGIALHGPKNAVDKVVKGARMHP